MAVGVFFADVKNKLGKKEAISGEALDVYYIY